MIISRCRDKILTRTHAQQAVRLSKSFNKEVIFTNGCFDLLHIGHVRSLEQAATLGETLVVGVNSDETVTDLKGKGRPYIPHKQRMEMVASIHCVTYVVPFDEPTPLELILALEPDMEVKGGDWGMDEIVGRQYVAAWGGEVAQLTTCKGVSTSSILNRVRDPR